MKNLISSILFLCLMSCQVEDRKTTTIQFDIIGLNKGDTIVLSTIQKPIYEILSEDTLYVTEANQGLFSKKLTHTTCISINYQPQNKEIDSYYLGRFLLKPGDNLHIQGTVTELSSIVASGGFYNDSLVARLEYMEKSNDTSLSDELKKSRTYMMKEINDNEYAVYLFLDNLTFVTFDELSARFDKLEPHIKTSYMGQCLKNTINTWRSLQPGEQAPDFSVIDIHENVIKLSDYKGQYLLLWCWDFCPTTFQVQKRVTDLYQRFGKERFSILAFTPDNPQKGVSKISVVGLDDTNPLVVNMRQSTLDQMAQPWSLIYTDHSANHFMKQKYYICNAVMLTFIAPDGKIVARSYFTDLEEVLQTIESTLQQNIFISTANGTK